VDNAADRKKIREAEKQAKRIEQQRAGVIRQIMGTTYGREWIWAKLEGAHIFQSSFADNALRMAFLEGERNLGIGLLNDVMRFCPDEFILAMREANERYTHGTVPGGAPAAEYSGGEDGNGRAETEYEFDFDADAGGREN